MEFRVQRHGVIDSSSEAAFRALEAGAARHGDAHVAAGQTAGRGRLGRPWESAESEGLYLSVVLLPTEPLTHPALLTVAAGLAVRDAVVDLGGSEVSLKWPNDVMVAGAKLAGILVESRGFDPARPHYVVGIGVNVAQRDFPADLKAERAVTSLSLLGLDKSREQVEGRVLQHLAARLAAAPDRLPELETDYLEATGLRGAAVRLRRGAEVGEGFLEGFSLREGLLLRRRDGWLTKFPVEHVTAVEPVS